MKRNILLTTSDAEAIIGRLTKPDREKIRFMLEHKDAIVFIESFGNSKLIHYDGFADAKVKINWDNLLVLLPGSNFIKVHNSYLINFDNVLWPHLAKRDLGVRMSNEKMIPVSRNEAKTIKEKCRSEGKGKAYCKKADNV